MRQILFQIGKNFYGDFSDAATGLWRGLFELYAMSRVALYPSTQVPHRYSLRALNDGRHEMVEFQTSIRETCGSKLSQDTDILEVFLNFPGSAQANTIYRAVYWITCHDPH